MAYFKAWPVRQRLFAAIFLFILLSGCASAPPVREIPPRHTLAEFSHEKGISPFDVYDPIEGFNRGTYRFNYYFDTYFYLKVVDFYEKVTPDYVEDRVSDFFSNVLEVNNLVNCILQLQAGCTAKTVGRIVVNSTVGLGGLWDPATDWGLERESRDLGQTLGFYGLHAGPYIVLPILGPSNVRDTIGLAGDFETIEAILTYGLDVDTVPDLAFHGVLAVDRRHLNKSRYYGTGSPFEYELLRMLYTKYRQVKIKKVREK